MSTLRTLTPRMLIRFTQIDYALDMAFVATVPTSTGDIQVGVGRYMTPPGKKQCEFAIAIADDWQHCGLGHHIMKQLIKHACNHGLRTMYGHVLAANAPMLKLCTKLGFNITQSDEGPAVRYAVLAITAAHQDIKFTLPSATPEERKTHDH